MTTSTAISRAVMVPNLGRANLGLVNQLVYMESAAASQPRSSTYPSIDTTRVVRAISTASPPDIETAKLDTRKQTLGTYYLFLQRKRSTITYSRVAWRPSSFASSSRG